MKIAVLNQYQHFLSTVITLKTFVLYVYPLVTGKFAVDYTRNINGFKQYRWPSGNCLNQPKADVSC